ncbi:SH3 domain protein [Niveomyces insectorum RCEF 264]|uniref:SH3 domain protein n=1 Tax=Niveomyces insectorum RCEF 264 TaxID=1081102 RepID=A0A167ZQW5_9HYPO|nr:SH3 domain protein [Niveomyces insectorum RCEF 264]
MARFRPLVRPQGLHRRDLWDSFTSAIGDAFDEKHTTTSKKDDTLTTSKTIMKTKTPSGYTGPLTTKTTSKTSPTTAPKAATTSKSAPKTSMTSGTGTTSLPTAIKPTTAATAGTKLTLDTAAQPTTQATLSTTHAAETATGTPPSSSGTSAGAKAGIAIGVLAGIFMVSVLVFYLFRKRQKQAERQRVEDDEKRNSPFAHSAAIGGTVAAAGSTRGGGNYPDRRTSRGAGAQGAAIALQNTPPVRNPSVGASAWERPTTNPDTNNPFDDDAERLNTPSQNSFDHIDSAVGAPSNTSAAVGAVAGSGLLRKASTRKDGLQSLDLTLNPLRSGNLEPVPPSPAGTDYSISSVKPGQSMGPSTSAAAIAAAGGPAVSTVHRVQLDFKPSLEDELELRAGQLIRLLHEYDDGWALCIRLDRSQQGVVPRTCLSTRPVKPRPPPGGVVRDPPVNAKNRSNRQMVPQDGSGPNGPTGRSGGSQISTDRSHTPQDTAGPQPDPGQINSRMRQAGSIGRKPVPGQAY